MDVHRAGRIDGDIDVLVEDDVLGDHRAQDGSSTAAAVDVDSHRATGRGVIQIGKVLGDVVADDHVSIHIVSRQVERRTDVRMQVHAAETIADGDIVDDHVV